MAGPSSGADEIRAVAKAARSVLSGAVALIGGITAIAGIWSSSLVTALNISGVIGVGTLTVGAITWFSSRTTPVAKIRNTASAVGITALVTGLVFAVGRPLEGDELDFGLLTIVGAVNLLAVAVLALLAWQTISASAEPEMKTCPECAEQVLAAAVVCKHCHYRFDGKLAN
jgi:hypothetical protein